MSYGQPELVRVSYNSSVLFAILYISLFFLPFYAEILTLAHGVGTIDIALICGFPQVYLDLLNIANH